MMKAWRSIVRALGFGKREIPPFPHAELGDRCGLILESEALRVLEQQLAGAFRMSFMEHVRNRVMQANPQLTDDAYDWALLELRRFFLMTVLCKEQVPMYSGTADAIWHEMLLFTREYETFCRSFAGRVIHHEPHVEKPSGSAVRQKRVAFELIYGTLFRMFPMNEQLLGAFRKHRLTAAEIAELERLSVDELLQRWFRDEAKGARDAAAKLAASFHKGASEARRRRPSPNEPQLTGDYAAWLIAASVWQTQMRREDGDGSAGTASSGAGDGKHHGHDGDGGSGDSGGSGDGGGASCGSSCGGGCGGS
jgi:hypothetical protein